MAHWPEPHPEEGWEAQRVSDFSLVMDVVRAVRNLRAERKVTPGKRLAATIVAGPSQGGSDRFNILMSQLKTIAALATLDAYALRLEEGMDEKPLNQVSLVVSGVEIYLPVSELVDVEAERSRLQKELGEIEAQSARLEGLLASPFAQKAPPVVVDKERQKLATYKDTAQKLKDQMALL